MFFLRGFKDYSPLSELRVSETFDKYGVCLKNTVGNLSPFRVDYPLMRTIR
jgi:hypothetical protein